MQWMRKLTRNMIVMILKWFIVGLIALHILEELIYPKTPKGIGSVDFWILMAIMLLGFAIALLELVAYQQARKQKRSH
ncbi:hypothetical protein [Dictyobacter aurantiacus]|uniref:Uncharacterized protein n=1 Tax=Dictyobacter aurantiacus TaxID=1936993 RepID=A0A401ZE27_9CHLR|nr:hypothetical protein [Dictyobacter aurantiacus]GCE05096.1 hypothetical protein KDAU_24250 [Dictyobacter aurantiacus]